jgi:hypothetical protein
MKIKEFENQFSLVTSEKIALSFCDNWFSLGGKLFRPWKMEPMILRGFGSRRLKTHYFIRSVGFMRRVSLRNDREHFHSDYCECLDFS